MNIRFFFCFFFEQVPLILSAISCHINVHCIRMYVCRFCGNHINYPLFCSRFVYSFLISLFLVKFSFFSILFSVLFILLFSFSSLNRPIYRGTVAIWYIHITFTAVEKEKKKKKLNFLLCSKCTTIAFSFIFSIHSNDGSTNNRPFMLHIQLHSKHTEHLVLPYSIHSFIHS